MHLKYWLLQKSGINISVSMSGSTSGTRRTASELQIRLAVKSGLICETFFYIGQSKCDDGRETSVFKISAKAESWNYLCTYFFYKLWFNVKII